MEEYYYFDTSIWLDFFENRDEPNFPKSIWARKLIRKIIQEEGKIIFSDNNMIEFVENGYLEFEIEEKLNKFGDLVIHIDSTEKEIGKAKDLAQKRNVPKRDALHALIARDNNAILITIDNHFKKLTDIAIPHKPKDFI